MYTRVNDAPIYLIQSMHFSCLLDKQRSAYPAELYLKQDYDYQYYNNQAFKILVETDAKCEQIVSWQIRQVYRFVNTALSSEHRSLFHYKQKLITIKYNIEKEEVIVNLLADIKHGYFNPDVILTGHGGWNHGDGITQFINGAAVMMYSPIGASIEFTLGSDIENNWVHSNEYIVTEADLEMKSLPFTVEKFDASSPATLPNFSIASSQGTKARLIESVTGRILIEIPLHDKKSSISINDVIRLYPNRIIHYSACASLCNTDKQYYGCYKDVVVKRAKQLIKPSKISFFIPRYGLAQFQNKERNKPESNLLQKSL